MQSVKFIKTHCGTHGSVYTVAFLNYRLHRWIALVERFDSFIARLRFDCFSRVHAVVIFVSNWRLIGRLSGRFYATNRYCVELRVFERTQYVRNRTVLLLQVFFAENARRLRDFHLPCDRLKLLIYFLHKLISSYLVLNRINCQWLESHSFLQFINIRWSFWLHLTQSRVFFLLLSEPVTQMHITVFIVALFFNELLNRCNELAFVWFNVRYVHISIKQFILRDFQHRVVFGVIDHLKS